MSTFGDWLVDLVEPEWLIPMDAQDGATNLAASGSSRDATPTGLTPGDLATGPLHESLDTGATTFPDTLDGFVVPQDGFELFQTEQERSMGIWLYSTGVDDQFVVSDSHAGSSTAIGWLSAESHAKLFAGPLRVDPFPLPQNEWFLLGLNFRPAGSGEGWIKAHLNGQFVGEVEGTWTPFGSASDTHIGFQPAWRSWGGRACWAFAKAGEITEEEFAWIYEVGTGGLPGEPQDLATLSPRGQALLAKLPPYLADDDMMQRLCEAKAREFGRLEDFLTTVRAKTRPQNADDEYGLLGIWEGLTGLPVEPAGVSLAARRSRVLAALRRRGSGIGTSWGELISLLLNTSGWEHEENDPTPYKMSVHIPFPSTSFQAGAVESLLERITPAHIQLSITFSDTFRVGISEVGDSL